MRRIAPFLLVPLLALGGRAGTATAAPPPVNAQIVAGPGGFLSVGNYATVVTVAEQGQPVTFSSWDIEPHNAVSVKKVGKGRNRRPLFASRLLDFGESSPISGVTKLPPGTYEFFCTLHPWMRGQLVIETAPSP